HHGPPLRHRRLHRGDVGQDGRQEGPRLPPDQLVHPRARTLRRRRLQGGRDRGEHPLQAHPEV
ncbi:MAG: hypothetical protein AVDCRST_MAG01-01-157, partial [uncultured Rubrobacteraceae bacterium]